MRADNRLFDAHLYSLNHYILQNLTKRSRRADLKLKRDPVIKSYHFPPQLIDQDALSIVKRLQSLGYLAYFVGGCVRDALLGAHPKDFDIVTSALPREIRAIFRNAQLIGRRFKLAHLRFAGDKILEVATFRQPPSTDSIQDGVIVEDNEYGTPETDAYRRDFTINALFYDPIKRELIDYTGGLVDIDDRVLRSIGDPLVRFREDPIRMLRAIKFAARLGLSFDSAVGQALKSERVSLAEAAKPRLQQELVRYLQGGASMRSFELLHEHNLLRLLCPELHSWLRLSPNHLVEFYSLLESHDAYTVELWPRGQKEERILSLIFWPWLWSLISGQLEMRVKPYTELMVTSVKQRDLKLAIVRLLAPSATRIGMSIKTLHAVSRIICVLILHNWTYLGVLEKGKSSKIKGDVSFESLLVLQALHRAERVTDEVWTSVEPLWRICSEERSSYSETREPSRRQLIPKKPVIKPTKKRPRHIKRT